MTREDKELLLKDLCSRLPYGVIVAYRSQESNGDVKLTDGNVGYVAELGNGWWKECKPYLRPMSSMTEEEYKDLTEYTELDCSYDLVKSNLFEAEGLWSGYFFLSALIDWLLKYHFDFRNLIGLGLANEAPEGMY